MPDLSDSLVSSTDEAMSIDTSFLDKFRSGADTAVDTHSVVSADALAVEVEPEPQVDPDDARQEQGDHPEAVSPGEPETDDELEHDEDLEVEPERSETGTPVGQRGGGGGGAPPPGAAPGAPLAEGHIETAAPQIEEASEVEPIPAQAPAGRHDEREAAEETRAVSLEHTDHQDAVQAATTSRGGSSGGETLPNTGFRLTDTTSQPTIRSLPDRVLRALREQLRSTAVRELEVTDDEAVQFSRRLSQAGLVTAFLLAHLDLEIGVDDSTARAAELFRRHNPLLGRVSDRLDGLIDAESERGDELARVHDQLRQTQQAVGVLEVMIAYSIADRAENLGRGTVGVGDLDMTHRSALRAREMARESARKQQRIERDRDGRPIR